MSRREERRRQGLATLREAGVLMPEGHYDYGNGFHGRAYLNPHQLFRYPATIWRLAQDLLDVVPGDLLAQTDVVAGPATGGALLAHTLAGLLDGRRALTHPSCSFAPFTMVDGVPSLKRFYAGQMPGRRVLLADDVRNTGRTFEQCAALVREAGGTVLATVAICDRMEAVATAGAPNYALVEYPAPGNYPDGDCPLCRAGEPVVSF